MTTVKHNLKEQQVCLNNNKASRNFFIPKEPELTEPGEKKEGRYRQLKAGSKAREELANYQGLTSLTAGVFRDFKVMYGWSL